jgi:hypothetical protein
VHNLIKLVSERWKKNERPPIVASLPRLFHAGRFHATKCLKLEGTVTAGSSSLVECSSVAYRSLGTGEGEDGESSAAYGDRLGGQGTGLAEKEPDFSPLEAKHLSKQLIEDALALVEDAAAETSRRRLHVFEDEPAAAETVEDGPAPPKPAAAAKATGKRKGRGTEKPL